jgi:hypothetical protein
MDDSQTSERLSIEFIENEVNLSNTFLDLADVEEDAPDRVAQVRAKAQQGYDVASTWIGKIHDASERERLGSKLDLLKQRLDRRHA